MSSTPHFCLLFLLLSSFTLLTFQTQGRTITKPLEAQQQKGVAEMMVRSRTIGSRPPKCDDIRCHSCGGQCVAVQVPVTAAAQPQTNYFTHHVGSVPTTDGYNRGGEDFSNYKPMSWKCKCGSFIFNP